MADEVRADPEALVRLAKATLAGADAMIDGWSAAQGAVVPPGDSWGATPAPGRAPPLVSPGPRRPWTPRGAPGHGLRGRRRPALSGGVRLSAGRLGGRRAAAPGPGRGRGGLGRDNLTGGAGDDLLEGGELDDTAYGLGGNDKMDGGAGQDYLEGGAGRDELTGGAGSDMLSGGRDDDVVRGGTGDDRIYSGWGRDTVDAGAGADTVFGQNDDTVRSAETVVNVQLSDDVDFIKVSGSPDFVARVQADLDLLRASPTGQQMLGNLQRASDDSANWFYEGNGLTISEMTKENGAANQIDNRLFGEKWTIEYNPSFDTLHDGPPVTILYHEMGHVYDFAHDTLAEGTYDGPGNPGVNNLERVAAGLPIDHDGDPNTPEQIDPDHPIQYTENGLREELGAPRRPRY